MSQKEEILKILTERVSFDSEFIIENHRHLYHKLSSRISDLKRDGHVIEIQKNADYRKIKYTLLPSENEEIIPRYYVNRQAVFAFE